MLVHEESSDAQLFDRSGRPIHIIDTGEVYWRYAKSALQILRESQHALRGVSVHIQEMTQDEMELLLNTGALDVGIAFDQTHSSDIQALPLLTETLALVVNRQHPLAQQQQVDPSILQSQRLVLLEREFATRDQIDRYCRQQGLTPNVAMEANALSAVIEVIRRTSLSTLLPSTLAQVYTDLVAINLNGQPLARTAALLLRHNAYHSFATQAFTQIAQQVAQALNTPQA